MAFPYDPANARVRVSTTVGGTYTVVGKVRTAPYTEGTENRSKIRYLGGQIVRPGDNTLTGSVTWLYDDGDTTGQTIIRTAKRNGTTVFLQWCPAGTATGAKALQMEVSITEITGNLDADAQVVDGGFSWEGVDDSPTEITLA